MDLSKRGKGIMSKKILKNDNLFNIAVDELNIFLIIMLPVTFWWETVCFFPFGKQRAQPADVSSILTI